MIERLARIPGTARLPSESQARAALSGFAASLSGEPASLRALVAAILDRQERIVEAEEALESGGSRNSERMHPTGNETVSGVKTFADGIVLFDEEDYAYRGVIYCREPLVFDGTTQFVDETRAPDFSGDCRAIRSADLAELMSFAAHHRSLFASEGGVYDLADSVYDLKTACLNIRQAILNYEQSTGRSLAADWADFRAVIAGGAAPAGSTMSEDRIAEIRRRIVSVAEGHLMSDGADTTNPMVRIYRIALQIELFERAVGIASFPDFDLPFSSASAAAALQQILGD